MFNTCPQREDKMMRSTYWQELWAHIPSTRKDENANRERRNAPHSVSLPHPAAPPMCTTSVNTTAQGFGRGQGRNVPAWLAREQANTSNNQSQHQGPTSPGRQQQREDPWIVPILVRVNTVNVSGGTPMPISINNRLPCVDFRVGIGVHHSPSLRMLVDSGAAMNTGHLPYHRSIMA